VGGQTQIEMLTLPIRSTSMSHKISILNFRIQINFKSYGRLSWDFTDVAG
jgi:hypothetical protein